MIDGRKPKLLDASRVMGRPGAVVAAGLGIACGVILLFSVLAASTYAVALVADGLLSGPARVVSDGSIAGGQAVWFGPEAASPSESPVPSPTATATPAPNCAPSGQCAPSGNVAGWDQVFVTNFPGTVPVGAFSGCTSDSDGTEASAYCTGLESYGGYYTNWWAYPSGWPDTAEECIQGSSSCPDPGLHIPVGGTYEPQSVVSVSNNEMHINMYRPAGSGNNAVATVVPRACMNQKYGMYTERFMVTNETPGFKSAHLFYQGGFEIDYPENDYGTTISAYTHPGGANFSTSATWGQWHTTSIEWTAGSIKFYLDGALIGTTSASVPNITMSWILQNESSILGPYASPGATSDLNIAWVACYKAAS